MKKGEDMKKWVPTILCGVGALLIVSAIQPGIIELLVGISGGLVVYQAGYLRAKLVYGSR